jgi:hypothetical protein
MSTTRDTTRTVRAIRKEKPLPVPRPPATPRDPGGRHVPAGGRPTGVVCPGAGGPAQAARGHEAIEETVIESPAQKMLRKPSALGGKSIHLMVVEGGMKGRSFDLTGLGTYVIGRKDCDIPVDDEKVSRKHASIVIAREGQYVVQDLASRNGTFVNGVRLSRRNLAHNDLIRVGGTTFRFTVFDGPVPVQS